MGHLKNLNIVITSGASGIGSEIESDNIIGNIVVEVP